MAANFSTGRTSTWRSLAALATATASGCSERCSTDAAHFSTSAGASAVPSGRLAVMMCVTVGRPSVMVPVLSRNTVRTPDSRSSASPLRTRIPYSAALPVPTSRAVGVASPSAQGQAMMSTVTSATVANTRAGSGPTSNQSTNAAIARARTTGTNTPATRSESR